MKNFIFAVATAIAAFAFNSCSDTVEASMDLIINANEAQNQELEIITKHESSEHVDNIVYDYHIAALISGNVEFENQRYSATHELNVPDATFKRSIATNLQETTIYFNSDTEEFDLAGTKVCAYAELIDCENVTFELNGNCYCHPKFAQNGAIARLDCCPIVPVRMETGKINGNIFTAEVIFKGDSEVRYPVEFAIIDEDVYAYEYDEYVTVTGNGTATLNEYETKNGVRTGKVNILKGEFKASLKAGVEIVKTSDNNPTLNNVIPTISENMASFSYTLGEDTFFDGWTLEIPSDVAFTASNGEQIRRPFEFKWVVKSESFTGNNGTWSNKASLSIPKNQDEVIKISSDTQVIRVVTNVYGYEYADTVTVTGNGTATLEEYETLNGARTGKVNILEGTFSVSFAASSEIVKTSTNTPSLLSTIGNINGNNVSFSYTLDNTSFTDNWFASLPSKVEFVTSDGNSISRSFSDSWVVMSTSFTQNGNVWMNTAELSIANYVCASDTQYIRIEAVKGYEHDNFATVLSSTEVGLNVYPTVNGDRTGEVIIVKGYYSATLTAGAMLERSSKEALMLNNKSANVSGNNASFNYSLGNESVNDEWKYSASASANFTLPDNSAVNIPIQATYSVMSTDFRLNNDVYSNTASLYAGNIAVASDVQQIKVEAPVEALIDGYTAISAYITTCYYSENKTLINDGNHLVIVFRNNTDNTKYIVRQTVSTTSTVGTDFAFSNLNENAVYSKINVDGKWVPAYLDVISEKNVAVQWGYTQINGNSELPINRMAVTTGGLINPIIEEGKVVNGIVTINGLKIK